MAVAAAAEPVRASRRGIWSWMLFDWAQQPFHTLIITFVFAPYFTKHIASSSAHGQELWGYATGIGGFLIAVMSPVCGAIADASGPRKPWILAFSIIGAIGCWMLWYAVPGMSDTTIVLLALVLALIGFEFAAVFNNAMMPDLVPRSELGRLSGTAWGLGYVGGIIALVLMLGFLSTPPGSETTLFGLKPLFGLDPARHEGDRASGPLTAIWYIIFILPLFLWTPDAPRRPRVRGVIARGLSELWQTLRALPRERSYFSFLLSSMFYRDALAALFGFAGIYAEGVLGWTLVQVGMFGIFVSITGALGGWFGGIVDQRRGPKTVITWSIILLSICSLVVISTTNTEVLFVTVTADGGTSLLPNIVFYIAGAVIGAVGGAIQAASRTLLVDQVPRGKVTEAFGLYALSGKATAFLGPLGIGVATGFFASEAMGLSDADAQRLGVTPIILLFLIGLALLPWVKSRPYER